MEMARERHIQAIVAEERVQQALERISQARAPLLPGLQGTASQYRRTVNLEALGIGFNVPGFDTFVGPFNTFDARISLTQTLFDAGVLSRLKAAHLGQRLSEADWRKARQDAMALVAKLFIDAKRAQERIPWVKAQFSRDVAERQVAQQGQGLGLQSELEKIQAGAVEEQSRAQVTSAETEAVERRLDLAAALGLPQDQAIDFVMEDKIETLPVPKVDEIPSLVAAHPEVESAERLVRQREQDRKTEVAAFYPKLMGNADFGASGDNPADSDATYNFGGQLTIPIYAGGLRKARVREAASRVQESEAQLEDTRRRQEAKAGSALAALTQAKQLWKAAGVNLNLTERQVNIAQLRYGSGLGSKLELVQAQAGRASALDVRSETLATYYQARVNLAHATGTLETWLQSGEKP